MALGVGGGLILGYVSAISHLFFGYFSVISFKVAMHAESRRYVEGFFALGVSSQNFWVSKMSLKIEILEVSLRFFLCLVYRHGIFGLSKMSLKLKLLR